MTKLWVGLLVAAGAALTGTAWVGVQAYPGGVENYVTDAAPYCASCHSSYSPVQVRNVAQKAELRRDIDVHYQAVTAGDGGYKELSAEQRATLLQQIQALDGRAKVELTLPQKLVPGQTATIEVRVSGGDGPVVGVVLLDSDLRYQARPIASSGWQVVGAPTVTGPDGKPQTTWIDRREPGTPVNLSFVQVYGVEAGKPGTSTVKYTVKAPRDAGTYPVAAALLYGVEMASEVGTVTTPQGAKLPRGGYTGRSGRVMFSSLARVEVRPGATPK